MRSIADELRIESLRAFARLSAEERIALALHLGDDDVALHSEAHGIDEAESRTALRRARATGRVPSRSNDPERP